MKKFSTYVYEREVVWNFKEVFIDAETEEEAKKILESVEQDFQANVNKIEFGDIVDTTYSDDDSYNCIELQDNPIEEIECGS